MKVDYTKFNIQRVSVFMLFGNFISPVETMR